MFPSFDDVLIEQTGGRPFVFVIMEYKDKWPLYERIAGAVQSEFGMACLRADHFKSSGQDLLSKVHLLIERAEAVVAEITTTSENVFYEVGYALATRKQPLLLVEKAKARKVPTDLKGIEKVEYKLDQFGTAEFEQELIAHLRPKLRTGIDLLRKMLLAERSDGNYILSSPKYPLPNSQIWGQVYDTKTFGDYLAILRLVSAFGFMGGPGSDIELISAQHIPPDTPERPWNLYLIGSGNANPLADVMLARLQGDASQLWAFEPMEGYTREDAGWPSALYEYVDGERLCCPSRLWSVDAGLAKVPTPDEGQGGEKKSLVWKEDYGLIVRGPHPHPANEGRLVFLLAGAHALGTGAVGIAATDPIRIRQIRDMLPPDVLEDKRRTFWVLVKGVANADYRLDSTGVSIERVGVIN